MFPSSGAVAQGFYPGGETSYKSRELLITQRNDFIKEQDVAKFKPKGTAENRGLLGCFHVQVSVNSTAVNTRVCVSF